VAAKAPPGSTTIEVFEPDQEDAGSGPWFEAGDRIVINPGGETEELAVVVGLGSLMLETPTAFEHLAGETISLVPSGPNAALLAGAAGIVILLVAGALVLVRRRARPA
jgi:hypothetical protein